MLDECASVCYNPEYAGMAELADAPDLGSGGQPCRFDPCYPYQYLFCEIIQYAAKECVQ